MVISALPHMFSRWEDGRAYRNFISSRRDLDIAIVSNEIGKGDGVALSTIRFRSITRPQQNGVGSVAICRSEPAARRWRQSFFR